MTAVSLSSLARLAVAALLVRASSAQQPEMAHLSVTGKAGELALDFMGHSANCSAAWGVQYGTSPDFSGASFVAAYACTDFTAQEPGPSYALRALMTGLQRGTRYYYAAGIEGGRAPFSQIFSFVYDSASLRAGGAQYAVLADFGYFNSESLGKLMADTYNGRFDMLLHAGDLAYDLDSEKGDVGDGYFRQIQPIVSQMPYMAIPGNQ